MREGCYIVDDQRLQTEYRLPIVVKAALTSNRDVEVLFAGGMTGTVLEVNEQHPDYVDDDEDGLVVLPFPDGHVELTWPTPERFAELEAQMEALPADGWPELKDESAIQTWLGRMFKGF